MFSQLNPLFTQSRWLPFVLLTLSNIFMTFAWYGHLKFKNRRSAGHPRELGHRFL